MKVFIFSNFVHLSKIQFVILFYLHFLLVLKPIFDRNKFHYQWRREFWSFWGWICTGDYLGWQCCYHVCHWTCHFCHWEIWKKKKYLNQFHEKLSWNMITVAKKLLWNMYSKLSRKKITMYLRFRRFFWNTIFLCLDMIFIWSFPQFSVRRIVVRPNTSWQKYWFSSKMFSTFLRDFLSRLNKPFDIWRILPSSFLVLQKYDNKV